MFKRIYRPIVVEIVTCMCKKIVTATNFSSLTATSLDILIILFNFKSDSSLGNLVENVC